MVPSDRENKNGDRQAKKKSDTTSVSSILTSSVSAWALSLRYGSKAEILRFPSYQFCLDSLSYKGGIYMSPVYLSFTSVRTEETTGNLLKK